MNPFPGTVDLFAILYVLFLPAYVMGRVLAPGQPLLLRFLTGTLPVLLIMPLVAAWLGFWLGIPMDAALLYGLASLFLLVGGAVQWHRYRKRSRTLST